MSRYIDADKLLTDELTHTLPNGCGRSSGRVVIFIEDIDMQPTADVVEVRHGHWIRESFIDKHGDEMFTSPKCSLCGNIETFGSKYCPECGAYMRGTNNGEE